MFRLESTVSSENTWKLCIYTCPIPKPNSHNSFFFSDVFSSSIINRRTSTLKWNLHVQLQLSYQFQTWLHVQCYRSTTRQEATPQLNSQKIAPFEDFEVMECPFWRGKHFQVLCWFFVGKLCVKVWFSTFIYIYIHLVMIRNMNMQSKQHLTMQFYRARRGTSSHCCRFIRFSNRTMSKLAWPEIHFVAILYVKLSSVWQSFDTHSHNIPLWASTIIGSNIILKRLKTSQVNTRLDKTAFPSTSPLGMLVSEENPSLRVLMKVFQSHSLQKSIRNGWMWWCKWLTLWDIMGPTKNVQHSFERNSTPPFWVNYFIPGKPGIRKKRYTAESVRFLFGKAPLLFPALAA